MAAQHRAASVRWPGQRRRAGELQAIALPALPVSPLKAPRQSLPMGNTEHPQHLPSCGQTGPADHLALLQYDLAFRPRSLMVFYQLAPD